MARGLTRREFGAGVLGLAAFTGAGMRVSFAQSAKYKLRYGTAFPADHPGVARIQEAAKAIATETNGTVDLQVYPNSQLGSEPDMFSQTRSGALDFMSTSGVNQTVVPVGGINAVAFAFEDYSKVWAAMDGELGNHVREQFGKAGLYVFPKMLDNGYRNITSSAKPVNGPEDLKGFKIRVPGNQLWVTMFKALGAAPTPINFGELYAALQTHVVDGQENPLALISSAKLYEVQKYIALSGHMWDGHHIFTNGKKWAAMPEEIKAVISKRLTEAAVRERADIVALNDKLVETLTAAGAVFNKPEKKPFRDVLSSAGYYTEWKSKFGEEPWALLEKYAGKL
ncbi:ABC transporter substrate-binding protein [Alsobacter soli]|uniref:ABC transporter substrate-binding protein n=1 Tax=Alsobacter soli TaxID=2109933 RepID=A0A2T1HR95_9HYPH|nr:TRAP transporter substrate-binding protein [Alsobacter soli]PSC04181.1 ABC transporter substrate-binding protein [Alsobacter soli]